eukprot:gene10634-12374_t
MVGFTNPEQLKQALEKFKDANNVSDWILVSYKDANTFQYVCSGTGGSKSLVQHLKDNEVLYILMRQVYSESDPGFKEGIIGNKANTKDIFIAWTGPSVGIIEKGKKKSHVADAKALFQPFHAELTAINSANFTDAIVKDRSSPLSGSHIID